MIETIPVSSLQEFLDLIDPKMKSPIFKKNEKKMNIGKTGKRLNAPPREKEEPLWFRGHSNHEWSLQPNLYRKVKAISKPAEFWPLILENEKKTYEEFKVRNFHLVSTPPTDKYLWLSLMQHHNMATRLLDWSEQVIPALFFAISDYFLKPKTTGDLPCIWILKPSILKSYSIGLYNKMFGKKIIEPEDSIISLLQLQEDNNHDLGKLLDTFPMPVLAPYQFSRIQAQFGAFTIFPINPKCCRSLRLPNSGLSLEKMPEAGEYLYKIVVVRPAHISDQLKKIGIKRSMFFPEIPNVSTEIEEKYLRDIR